MATIAAPATFWPIDFTLGWIKFSSLALGKPVLSQHFRYKMLFGSHGFLCCNSTSSHWVKLAARLSVAECLESTAVLNHSDSNFLSWFVFTLCTKTFKQWMMRPSSASTYTQSMQASTVWEQWCQHRIRLHAVHVYKHISDFTLQTWKWNQPPHLPSGWKVNKHTD